MKLETQIRELIALGASVTANCHPCVQYHVNQALESGAEVEAVNEAIEVGKMVRKGAAGEMNKLLLSLGETVLAPAGVAGAGCGCGA